MKRTVVIILLTAMIFTLSACKKNNVAQATPIDDIEHDNVIETANYILPENVEAWVVSGSVDASHVVINIVNTSKYEITFPTEFRLEKIEGDYWVDFPAKSEPDWDTTLYTVGPNSAKKMTVGFNLAYGELDSGIYRIIKRLYVRDDKTEYNISCEFQID